MSSLISTLRSNRSFSEQEQKLVHAILSCLQKVAEMNAFELAERADVSASTVYRLCRKLGFDGFGPFRTALAASFRDTMFQDVDIDFNIPFGKEDDTGTVVRKMGALYKYSVGDILPHL